MADTLALDRITTEGTQARVALSDTVIREYAAALAQGDEFPPIEVYFDDTAYWLADGFHRVQAAKGAGRDTIAATIHQGGQREALLHALGANDTHGHRRTDIDRRHAIELMLADAEWQAWSNSAIARQCRVSEFLVRTVRQEREPAKEKTQETPERPRKVTRGGKTYTMHTGRIGSATTAKAPAASRPALSPAPLPSAALSESRAPRTETPPTVSSIESKIDTPAAVVPHTYQEEAAPCPAMPSETADAASPEPITPPPPSLIDVWQQANDDERKAFVTAYRDELHLLLAAHDEPPKKHVSTAQRTPRPQPQQQKRRRAAAGKR